MVHMKVVKRVDAKSSHQKRGKKPFVLFLKKKKKEKSDQCLFLRICLKQTFTELNSHELKIN